MTHDPDPGLPRQFMTRREQAAPSPWWTQTASSYSTEGSSSACRAPEGQELSPAPGPACVRERSVRRPRTDPTHSPAVPWPVAPSPCGVATPSRPLPFLLRLPQ